MNNYIIDAYKALPKYIIDLYIDFAKYHYLYYQASNRIHYLQNVFTDKNIIYVQNINHDNFQIAFKNFLNAIYIGNDFLSNQNYCKEYFEIVYRTLLNKKISLNDKFITDIIEILTNESIDKFVRIALCYQISCKNQLFGQDSVLVLTIIFNNFMFLEDNSFSLTFIFLSSIIYNYKFFMLNAIYLNNDEWIKFFCKILSQDINNNIQYTKQYQKLLDETENDLNDVINITRQKEIFNFLFSKPIFSANDLAESLNVTRGQAIRYINKFLEKNIIIKNNVHKNCTYKFDKLLKLVSYPVKEGDSQ